jgi:ATPase family protein associated with various cellular activities (AAA)
MPNSRNTRKTKGVHRSSPYETPVQTIDGQMYTLEGDKVDDPELIELMQRAGTWNRSDQRRFMVKYRKYVEKKSGQKPPKSAIQNIMSRYPRVQNLPTIKRHNRNKSKPPSKGRRVSFDSDKDDDDTPIVISTKTRSKSNSSQSIRRSSRLRAKNGDDQIVYDGQTQNELTNDTPRRSTRSTKSLVLANTNEPPVHHDPFEPEPEYDPEYDPVLDDEFDFDQIQGQNLDKYEFSDEGDSECDSLGSEDSYSNDSGDEPPISIHEELNELHDDVPMPSSRKRKRELDEMDSSARENFHSKLREIRESYNSQKVDIAKVIHSVFNEEDNNWFYSRLGRLKLMDGKEKYDLEDEIQRKFATLTSLQKAGLYQKFNRPAERNIIKEILDSDKPDDMKQIMINRMMNTPNDGGEEYQKALVWLDVVMSIPTECKNMIGSNNDNEEGVELDVGFGSILFRLKQNLDSNLFGMDNVKRQIMQAVTTIQNDPESQGYIIALVGDPGVGKTTISSQIAETIGMGFGQIPCGSISDRSGVVGSTSTFIGAIPGLFTQLLMRTEQLNNVVLLDELDKLPDKSLLPTLLQVLDREQNFRFKDAFCPEVDIDMSKNLYIIAVNDISGFDKALRDRMKVIHVSGYDTDQKTHICHEHIIPKIQSKTGITPDIDYDTIHYFVNKVSPQISGVRDITRYFEDIYEKLQLIHRFTEYLKHDPEAWGVALDIAANTTERATRRSKRRRTTKAQSPSNDTTANAKNDPTSNEDPMITKFREVLKTHLSFDIPEGVDLRDINSIKTLNVKLIESLED